MRITARTDYALRAAVELAAAEPGVPVKAERLADAQKVPLKFLENILASLRHAGLVESRRGPEGGYLLARPPEEITLADFIRAIDGPLAGVQGRRPQDLEYEGVAAPLREVWVAVRAALRGVLEHVTLADVASGTLPPEVEALTGDPDAWVTHPPR
ncbi:MAG: Rrf2 family transcriptional regulator [Solirubrobacteraceae bacterium]